MKYRLLAALPWVAALVTMLVGASRLGATDDVVLRAPLDVVRLLAVVGCVLAASAFGRDERLFRAWLLNGACAMIFFARDMMLVAASRGVVAQSGAFTSALNVLVVSGNASAIVGTWLLARTWRVAGIELPASALQRRLATVVVAAIALAITGGALAIDLRTAATGDLQGLVDGFSRACDVVELCLVAPIALTALAMRGGALRWPWGLFTASLLCWLFYDAAEAIGHLLGVAPAAVRVPREALRVLACAYLAAAAVAQRLAVMRP